MTEYVQYTPALEPGAEFCYNSHMKLLNRICLTALLLITLSGCARAPEGTLLTPVRAFSVELTLAATINDQFYYYAVIDIDGGTAGPVPVFPGITPGQGWVTGSATHFVQYHLGQFTIHQFLPQGQFVQSTQIGTPIRSSAVGRTISFTIDLNDLGATGETIDVNFITIDNPLDQHRTLDALAEGGASVLNVDITQDDTIDNARLGFIEQPEDLLNENDAPVATTDLTRALDMTDWSIGIDI